MNETLPLEHVLAHVRDTLATDDRVGELGLEVIAESDAGLDVVVVRGAVSTHARQAGVVPLTREVLGNYGCEHDVRDETHVTTAAAPDHAPEDL